MKGRRKRRLGLSARQLAWVNSARGLAAARAAAKISSEARRHKSRCEAKRKQDGLPCQNLALENGRCRLHGGLTPRGAQWHRVQYPGPKAPPAKLEKKLKELDRRRQRRAARLAVMTSEERERYDKLSRSVRPRSAAERAQGRSSRKVVQRGRNALPAPVSATMAAIDAQLAEISDRRAQLEAQLQAEPKGVFR